MDDARVESCPRGCASEPTATGDVAGGGPTDVPIACTLDAADLPDRLLAWRSLAGQARSRHTAPDGTVRIELGTAADVEGLARLVTAEQACCTFFSFAITVDERGVGLEVRAPDEAAHLVAGLLGDPD